MSMEETEEICTDDRDGTMVSSSPDSGLCDLDTKSEVEDPLPKRDTLDPFLHNRRLTLLKSLSQDSEYSLDTSPFDAEEFLHDMGFAGMSDPTIPDRFLPSLIQRLSRFPESEMESLHDRIIQSIGCFKRKEGKRRLFRNLSMGKDLQRYGRHFLGCPTSSHPLLRSNTDPSTFPYEETSYTSEASNSLQSGRLSSNDSCLHSLGSSKDECEFPESPIAILVSTASVDQEERSSQRDEHSMLPSKIETCVADASSQANLVDFEDVPSSEKESSDGEFVSTVEEIQKLTDKISDNKDDTLLMKSRCDSNELLDQREQEKNYSVEANLAGSSEESANPETYFTKQLFNSTKDIHASDENLSLDSATPTLEIKGNYSNTKHPLRRISNAQIYNPNFSKTLRSLEYQNEIDDNNLSNAVLESSGVEKHDANCQYLPQSEDCPTKLETRENTSDYVSISKDNMLSNNVTELEWNETVSSSCNISSFQSTPEINGHAFSKPKYSRDDSLTNFLSSMLDTNDILDFKSSVTPQNPFLKNKCDSDSELPGSFASSPFTVHSALDVENKDYSNEISKKMLTPFTPEKSANVKEVISKEPNRKRRVLRRMSSSLQGCDDVNYNDLNELKVGSFCNDYQTPAASPSFEMDPRSQLTHRNMKSSPYVSNHRVIYPCNSSPTTNLCSVCKKHCENNKNVIGCPKHASSIRYDCNSEWRKNSSYRKKDKLTSKRRRNLSCPSPEVRLNCSPWFESKAHNLNTTQCDCMVNNYQRHLSESISHKPFTFPGNLIRKETPPYNCCIGNISCRQKKYFVVAPSNTFNSSGIENDSLNTRYFRTPSPFFPPSHRKNETLLFCSNLENQNHNLCYSSPDLRHGCNAPSHNQSEEHYKQRPVHNLGKFSFESNTKYSPGALFRGDNQLSDDVFFPDTHHCSFHFKPSPEVKQDVKRNRMHVRTPQRQNSISVADSEISSQSWTTNSSPVQRLVSPCKETDVVDNHPELSSIINCSVGEDKIKVHTPSVSVSTEYQKSDVPSNESPSIVSDSKTLSTVTESKTKCLNVDAVTQPSSTNNKSEALLERKIRIFSKFLANLGNLSKSISDMDADNKHKSARDQKSSDVAVSDKRTKTRVLKVSCPVPSRKCSTPPPEFDKLLNLLKSMDSNTHPDNDVVTSTKSDILQLREVQENESPVYENRVLLQTTSDVEGQQQRSFKPVLYTSSVSLYINARDKKDTSINRREVKESGPSTDWKRDSPVPEKEENSGNFLSQMPFRGVSKEIEGLQLSIKKAKEMRISASKELHLLQELLSVDGTDEKHEIAKDEKLCTVNSSGHAQEIPPRTSKTNQALSDLREKSKNEVSEDTLFWQDEIKRVKEETKQVWQAKLDRMEARLTSQEDELHRLQNDNENLQKHLESRGSPICHCRSEGAQNGFGKIDSAFEDDEEYLNHKPSIPIQSTRQECDRLQERLMEEEQRADQLNLLLNQKLIELNKIQITLSKQTKEMIELEKSYLQLQCRLRKGTSKPVVARLCSRTSPFSSKNLCPKPSPPASPQPTKGAS